jgi:ASC-1-like (ASCH) protein
VGEDGDEKFINMDHVAIMRKSWGLLPKILSGEKTIESRWYKNKSAPWGKINSGDMVYFKNSGESVTVRVCVKKVLQFENLIPEIVRDLLVRYGRDDGITDIEKYYQLFIDKKYCLLIFLEKPQKIKPFEINKKGFGSMAAWMCVEDIRKIRRKSRVPRNKI